MIFEIFDPGIPAYMKYLDDYEFTSIVSYNDSSAPEIVGYNSSFFMHAYDYFFIASGVGRTHDVITVLRLSLTKRMLSVIDIYWIGVSNYITGKFNNGKSSFEFMPGCFKTGLSL